MVRHAGVPSGVGVQRKHRRVGHRACDHVGECIRRLSGPGGAPPQAGRARRVVGAARAVVRGGAADARARVCGQTCGHAHARSSTCVGIAARTKDGIYVCMYVYEYICMCIYIYIMNIKVCVYLCERWVWACMRPHRLRCARACDCARRRCGRRHHVRMRGYVRRDI